MRASRIAVVLLLVGSARADDAQVHEQASLVEAPDGPWLHLDVLLPPGLASFDATRASEHTTFALGRTHVTLEGAWWVSGVDVPANGEPNLDLRGQGWRAAVRVTRELGPLWITADASVNHVDGPYGTGTYRDLSLSIAKTHRLSRWMTGWIALSLGQRTWIGDVPAGEQDAFQVMFTLGTTFR